MIQEFLVALACVNNKGCSQTSNLYYSSHPEIQKALENSKTVANRYINSNIIIAAPAMFILVGGTSTIKLNKYFSAQVNKNDQIISFRYEF